MKAVYLLSKDEINGIRILANKIIYALAKEKNTFSREALHYAEEIRDILFEED